MKITIDDHISFEIRFDPFDREPGYDDDIRFAIHENAPSPDFKMLTAHEIGILLTPEQAEQMAAALWQAAQQSRDVPWPSRPRDKKAIVGPFANTYPHIAEFIAGEGWIELGQDEYSPSLLRALDAGGLIWESSAGHKTLDQALLALEEKLAAGPYR